MKKLEDEELMKREVHTGGKITDFGGIILMKFKNPPVGYMGKEVSSDLLPFILSKNIFYYFPPLVSLPLFFILLWAVSGGGADDA